MPYVGLGLYSNSILFILHLFNSNHYPLTNPMTKKSNWYTIFLIRWYTMSIVVGFQLTLFVTRVSWCPFAMWCEASALSSGNRASTSTTERVILLFRYQLVTLLLLLLLGFGRLPNALLLLLLLNLKSLNFQFLKLNF